ncbi:MAG: efflux RND transporter permease subunit [Reichenbachiella sp.]|uniref:efflux RND transporter permease subunit n=1 Tax=Reichenbachiella sp. TaxID=2184521 RepID=UPI003298EA29
MINKQTSIISILFAFLCLAFLATQLRHLEFDYELENFFPNNDPDLIYYQEFSQIFGHDNDYLLIGFETPDRLFDLEYLNQIDSGIRQIAKLASTLKVHSPTSMRTAVHTPMGLLPIPLLHLSNVEKIKKDSARFYQHPLYREMFISKSGNSLKAVIIHKRFKTKETADEYVSEIRKIFNSQSVKIRLAGKAVAQTAFVNAVKSDFASFILFAMVLIFGWLMVFMRRLTLIITAMSIAGFSVVATIGFMAVTGKEIDVLSSLIPTILLVVAMSDIIHLYSHIQAEYAKTTDLKLSINHAVRQVGFATLLTSFTTAVGFLTLITINVKPIIDLGIYAAAGIIIAFVITYLLYPTIVTIIKPTITPPSEKSYLNQLSPRIYNIILDRGKVVAFIAFILFAICLLGISKLKIDAYLVNDLPKNDPVKSDFVFFDQEFSGSKPFTLSLWTKNPALPIYSKTIIAEMDKIEQEIRVHTGAGDLTSPVSIVKLANQSLHGPSPAYYKLPDTEKEWKKAFQFIKKYHPERKSIKVSSDSQAQITGYFQDLGSRDATLKHAKLMNVLSEKVNPQLLGYRLTGTTLLIDKSHELLSKNLIKGLVLAMIIVGLISGLLFKSWRMIIITLIPNIFPILAVAAVMGFFQIPLNLSTSVIFAISFGIVVDDTIHFLSQFKYEYLQGKSKQESVRAALNKTGRPIIITTIILSSGFIVFCFSSFSATFYMGLFVCLSFINALLADLFLLPVLLLWWLPSKNLTR